MQSFYLVRVMTSDPDGAYFENFMLPGSDVSHVRAIAFRRFGSDRVASVEPVIFASVLPDDSDQDRA